MKELPKGWAETTVGDLGADGDVGILTGPFGSNLGREDFRETGVPVFTIGCLSEDGIKQSKLLYIDADKAVELESYRLREGDFLFSRMATVGRVGFVPKALEGSIFNYHLMRLRLDERKIEPRYFFHFVRGATSVSDYLESVNRGATRDGINTKLLASMPVQLAPKKEQRRIVAKLDSLRARSTRARQELDHIPKLIERYKQAILAKAFSGELTADWRVEHALPDWEDTTIDQIGEVMLGRQRSPANHNGPCMRPYVRAANITWRGWDLTDVKSMNFDGRDFSRFRLEPGDVLVNEGSGSAKEVGKPAIWRGEIDNCCFQNTLIRVRPARCTSEFLHRYILWCARSEQFVSSTQGVNIYHIGKEGLAQYPIPLPHPDEQVELVRRIDLALTWLGKIATEHARAEHLLPKLDQAILAKAFRGELVPQDPNDEPASVLLERIKATSNGAEQSRRRRVRSV